ncbi:Tn3 family transposase [Amycolatopsis sp. NPDC049253]|uniref:Tn3 family transposase n=1 Tax=Amycolatopsis sp. NPDC049253 TaxID=3155274 RepID=UPI0034387ED1
MSRSCDTFVRFPSRIVADASRAGPVWAARRCGLSRGKRPHTGPPLTRKLNTDLIAEHYDDLLRVAGSLEFGHANASLAGRLLGVRAAERAGHGAEGVRALRPRRYHGGVGRCRVAERPLEVLTAEGLPRCIAVPPGLRHAAAGSVTPAINWAKALPDTPKPRACGRSPWSASSTARCSRRIPPASASSPRVFRPPTRIQLSGVVDNTR